MYVKLVPTAQQYVPFLNQEISNCHCLLSLLFNTFIYCRKKEKKSEKVEKKKNKKKRRKKKDRKQEKKTTSSGKHALEKEIMRSVLFLRIFVWVGLYCSWTKDKADEKRAVRAGNKK